jgi:hypothetical protein
MSLFGTIEKQVIDFFRTKLEVETDIDPFDRVMRHRTLVDGHEVMVIEHDLEELAKVLAEIIEEQS